ncbi:MAG: hypothetical protein VW840_20615, partial [Gammaproteobacteria bacterium]
MQEIKTRTDQDYDLAYVLGEVNRKLLLLLVILTAISMTSVVVRAYSEGWLPVYNFYALATFTSICFFAFRKQFSYRVISWYLIGFHISVGMIGTIA